MIELFEKIDNIQLQRKSTLIEIFSLFSDRSITPELCFEHLKKSDLTKRSAGFLLQFISHLAIERNSEERLFPEIYSYFKEIFQDTSLFFMESFFYFLHMFNDTKLFQFPVDSQYLSLLKTQFLFISELQPKCIKDLNKTTPYKRSTIHFDQMINNFIDGGELEKYEKLQTLLVNTCKFPFANDLKFVAKWTRIDDKDFYKYLATSSMFETDGRYIIYDPYERAKLDNFVFSQEKQEKFYTQVKESLIKKRQKKLFDRFVANYLELSDIVHDVGLVMVSFSGKIKMNKRAEIDFGITEKDKLFIDSIIDKFKEDENDTEVYYIRGKSVEVILNDLIIEDLAIGYIIKFKDSTEQALIEKFTRHDIKNSLFSISATLKMIQERFEVKEENKYLINSSIDGINKIRKTFNELFSLKSDSFKPEKLFLNNIISEVVFNYTPVFRKKEIALFFKKGPECELYCDKSKVQRIIENLLNNAFKFSESGTGVMIETESDENYALVKVVDQGCGIKNEYGDNIFIAGARQSEHESIEGSGLGLAICKRFTEMHDGFITYANNIDKGVTFTISFPKKGKSNEKV
ncbi:MAG: HAMP domain-containing histidine kinase [Candidatus Delongbacteria bacterium]|nr:HAMP domain-containing histidine kinase [Candidatus Delongbacteria bacterium]MBN2834913.1 HAMP domain-containing histidine kinase [Candidatus Delongbacteria bacterium]